MAYKTIARNNNNIHDRYFYTGNYTDKVKLPSLVELGAIMYNGYGNQVDSSWYIGNDGTIYPYFAPASRYNTKRNIPNTNGNYDKYIWTRTHESDGISTQGTNHCVIQTFDSTSIYVGGVLFATSIYGSAYNTDYDCRIIGIIRFGKK